VPTHHVLRRIATGVYAISKPAGARRYYLARELAREIGVNESSISRWIARGYIKAEKRDGFMLISVAEAMRFSREGPRAATPLSARPRHPAADLSIKSAPP
jgi:hypothetical protein